MLCRNHANKSNGFNFSNSLTPFISTITPFTPTTHLLTRKKAVSKQIDTAFYLIWFN